MKAFVVCLFALVAPAGCARKEQEPERNLEANFRHVETPRVFRLGFDEGSKRWSCQINDAAPPRSLPRGELTNYLASFGFKFGDLVILPGYLRLLHGNRDELKWLSDYCDTNKVAIYLYQADRNSFLEEVFESPVFHWKTPFETPETVQETDYYCDGVLLGRGEKGQEATLNAIADARSRYVFAYGSLYHTTTSLPPEACPFYKPELLKKHAAKAGAILVRDDPSLGALVSSPEKGAKRVNTNSINAK